MKKRINSENAPKAIGPYSQAVRAGDYVFVSGMLPLDSETGLIVGNNPKEQTEKIFSNIKEVLKVEDLGFKDIVKVTVLLSDIAYFSDANEVYSRVFDGVEVLPSRAAFAVLGIPKGAMVEIEVTAYCGK